MYMYIHDVHIHHVPGIGMANISVDEEEFYAEGGSELATISQSPCFPSIIAFVVNFTS